MANNFHQMTIQATNSCYFIVSGINFTILKLIVTIIFFRFFSAEEEHVGTYKVSCIVLTE